MATFQAPERVASLRKNRDYVAYWIARSFSVLGSQATYVAFPLMALAVFGDPLSAALVTAASYASTLAVGLFAGALADRTNRKVIMVAAEVAQAGVMLSVALAVLAGSPALPLMCTLAFLNGALFATYGSASAAALPTIVGEKWLARALAREQSRDFALAVAGPALGGLLFVVSPELPFLLNAGTFLLAAAVTATMRTDLAPVEVDDRGRMRTSIVTGLAAVRRNRPLRQGLAFFSGQAFVLTASFFTVMALLSSAGQEVAAGVVAACQAVGGFVGSAVAIRIFERFDGSLLLIGQGVLWSGGLLVIADMPTAVVAGAAMGSMWIIVPTTRIVYQTHLTATVETAMRGRVQSTGFVTQSTASPLGPVVAGGLIGATSETATLLVLAGVSLAVTAAALVIPHWRSRIRWQRANSARRVVAEEADGMAGAE